MRVLLLGASFDNPNLGVGALAAGVVTCIVESHPAAEISLLDYARRPHPIHLKIDDSDVPIRTVSLRKKPCPANNIMLLLAVASMLRMLPQGRLRAWLTSRNAVLRSIWKSDLIVSIAGGDSFGDTYGLWRLIDVSMPQMLVLLLEKPLVLLPQTLGPFKGRAARILARVVLRRAAAIYARDYASLEEAAAVAGGIERLQSAKFCHDVGLVVSASRPSILDVAGITLERMEDAPLVGLNVSGLLYIGGYRRNDAFGCRDKYVELVEAVADAMIRARGARVLLVPHNIGKGSESDSDICAELYQAWQGKYGENIGLAQGQYSAAEMKYIIGQCDFFIGARMHACIGALSQGVPAVAIAYSRKFMGVMGALGVQELVLDPRTMTTEELVSKIVELYDRRREVHRSLEDKMPAVKRQILASMREACQVLEDKSMVAAA